MQPVLEVRLTAGYGKQTILHDVQFELADGERFGLIGSSGAGKSTLLLALLGLLPWKSGWAKGEVLLNGKNLLAMPEREARRLRGKVVALVPQSPLTALNNVLSLRTHFVEAWRAHSESVGTLDRRLSSLLQRVHLPVEASFLRRKPGEISVGQAQRVTLALALLHRPSILIADEPTSSLDPITQAEIIKLLRDVSEEENTSLLYISHDLLSVLQLTDKVALLDSGRIAERLSVRSIERDARHPLMQALLRTLPAPADVLLRHANSHLADDTSSHPLSTLPSSLEAYNLGAMACEALAK